MMTLLYELSSMSVGMLTDVGDGDGGKYPFFALPLALLQSCTSSSQWLNLEAERQGSLGNVFPYRIGLHREGSILTLKANMHHAEINNVVMNGTRWGQEGLQVLLQAPH